MEGKSEWRLHRMDIKVCINRGGFKINFKDCFKAINKKAKVSDTYIRDVCTILEMSMPTCTYTCTAKNLKNYCTLGSVWGAIVTFISFVSNCLVQILLKVIAPLMLGNLRIKFENKNCFTFKIDKFY